jgi:hypothetical protein
MYQIMKITIYLLIAFMLMGVEGCPSDPGGFSSNEVCSGEAPLFKLYVVSDTNAPFDIEIQSVGKAVHKTTKQTTLFNPITGMGMTYVYKTGVNREGGIINTPFKPTDIHKNKGCIKQYTVSVDVAAPWVAEVGRIPDSTHAQVGELLLAPPKKSSVELSCLAPQGKQIKSCFFQITIDNEVRQVINSQGNSYERAFPLVRAYVATTSGGGTSRIQTFVNE